MAFCLQPFNRIEIYENGDVYNCCPPFVNNYSIGNIFKSNFDEIWNGDKVKELRNKILNSDFSLCSDLCNKKNETEYCEKTYIDTVEDYPEEISVSSDNTCNVRCRICRDENFKTPYVKENLEEEINNIWLPVFKNAKLLRFGCSGEPFASYKETLIIKMAAQKYPNLKFHFHTNAILPNEKLLKKLNVFDKIDTITVSLHSASRWTYNKIIRGGKWDKVISNLKLYSKMKQENHLRSFRMIFCVYEENYKDMKKFIGFAKKFNAVPEFWALRENNCTQVGKNFEKYSLINPELIKILNSKEFKDENVVLYPELKKLINKEN